MQAAKPLLEMKAAIAKAKGSHKLPKVVKKNFTEDSLEVLTHFGLDAPYLLNEYSCSLEDVLIEKLKVIREQEARIAYLGGELYKLRNKQEFNIPKKM